MTDDNWLQKAIDNKFYPPPKKKSIPRYVKRIRQRKAIEKSEISRNIQRGIQTGLRCRHGVFASKCIVCDPKYKPPEVNLDEIPF